MMLFLSTVVSSRFPTTNNQLRIYSNPRQQATIHDERVIVQPVQGRQGSFAADTFRTRANISRIDPSIAEGPVTQTVITHNAAYQADNLDAYDSDCDDFFTAKVVLMADLSSHGSEVLSEETNVISIADSKETLMHEEESRSKMLLKQSDPMVLEKKVNTKPINYAELNRLYEDFGKRFVPQREFFDEQALHPNTDQSACSLVKIKAPQKLHKPMLYDGNVIVKETNVISIADSKETLMHEEESRSKMLLKQSDPMVLEKKVNTKPINYAELNRLYEDFGKRFVPQREFFDEQALHPNTDQSACSLVKIKAPQKLHKEIVEQSKSLNPLDSASYSTGKITATNKVPLRVPIPLEVIAQVSIVTKVYTRRPKVVQTILWYLDSRCSKYMTRDRSQLTNFVHKFLGTVKFGNDQIAKIMRKPDLSYLHVFGALCYPNSDSENLGKLQAKADIVQVAAAPRAVDLADSPVSTSINQDAP
uniref:Integrase, catalytic region, zinc finger, CCHC-type, peptidase aspartic, catalytic n=1 Tax=Tanacetum cinerariifolium TaxID=118510 RepID=A0A6L2NWD1_TANCI|nr:integrase, catalytic region, zinc finger, CCHC-type, peptidase aspartic, catalytic [Tanacetum cinerariifolium]